MVGKVSLSVSFLTWNAGLPITGARFFRNYLHLFPLPQNDDKRKDNDGKKHHNCSDHNAQEETWIAVFSRVGTNFFTTCVRLRIVMKFTCQAFAVNSTLELMILDIWKKENGWFSNSSVYSCIIRW